MNFDFSKFATMTADTVESAFSENPKDVVADIAKEIKTEEEKTEVKTLTAEQIKQQAEFLKEQKAKSEEKQEAQEAKEETKKDAKKDTKKKETKTTQKKNTSTPKKEEPVVYSRPRNVVAYGEQVYTETDANASLEDIRNTLVNTYGYSEFKDGNRCNMKFDAKSGEVYPEIIFNKKG